MRDGRPVGRRVGIDVRIRGGATSDELAAVLAVLRPREPSAYERWRRTRLAALRRTSG